MIGAGEAEEAEKTNLYLHQSISVALVIHEMKPCFILISGSILLPSSTECANLHSEMLWTTCILLTNAISVARSIVTAIAQTMHGHFIFFCLQARS